MDPSVEEHPGSASNETKNGADPSQQGAANMSQPHNERCNGSAHVETRYIHHIIYQQPAAQQPNGAPVEEMLPFLNQPPYYQTQAQFQQRAYYDPNRYDRNDQQEAFGQGPSDLDNSNSSNGQNVRRNGNSNGGSSFTDSVDSAVKLSKTLFFKFGKSKQSDHRSQAKYLNRKKGAAPQKDQKRESSDSEKRNCEKRNSAQTDNFSADDELETSLGENATDQSSEQEDDQTGNSAADWSEILNIPGPKRIWTGLQGIAVSLFGIFLPAFLFFASIASAPKRFTLVLLHHPVETSIELLLVASIPLINYFVWNALCKGKTNVSRLLVMALGSALTSSLAIAGICIAALFGGNNDLANSIGTDFSLGFTWLGILSLVSGGVSAFLINKLRLSWELPMTRFKVIAQAISGMVLTLIAFTGSEYRPWCIRMAQSQAVSVDAKQKTAGLAWLRQLRPEREMLMECADARAAGLAGLFYPLKQSTQHQLYFQLTGTPYSFRDMNATDLSSMPDDYLRRHVVGDRIENLVLTRSSLTGALHPNTLTSTLNWTFVVKNGNSMPQEARAEIGLPPGAAITGLTVWHRGESEDPDFVASNKVDGAQMSSEGHDSPAMVTDLGHGRALLHAYPVPPEEELKIRVSMVVPMKAETDTSASLITPQLIATNFGLNGDHLVRLRSATDLSSSSKSMSKGVSPTGEKVISGQFDEKQLETNGVTIFASRSVTSKPYVVLDRISTALHEQDRKEHEARLKAKQSSTEQQDDSKLKEVVVMIDGSRGVTAQIDQLSRVLYPTKKKNAPAKKTKIRTIQSHYLVEGINKVGAAAPKHLVVVIDGSEKMAKSMPEIELALRQIPPTVPTSVIIANQENAALAKPILLSKRLEDLKNIKFIGGQDNLKAVVDGAELAGESKGGALLWIHGPQPVINEEIYIMSPYTAAPSFYELSLGAGTDTFEFFKNHTEIGPFCQVPRDGANIGTDLASFFTKWRPGSSSYAVEMQDATKMPKDFQKPSDEEAREILIVHAIKECNKLVASRHFKKAARIALNYGFVSPVSSALINGQPKADAGDVEQQNESSNSTDTASSESAQSQNASSDSGTSGGADAFSAAPVLQGATNGSIGPQGSDATVIMGVNTAGTVRVNNLANLEALLNIIANLGEILCLLGGIAMAIQGFASKSVLKLGEDIELGPGGKVVLGILIATIGISIPGIINWFVASARDANLFS